MKKSLFLILSVLLFAFTTACDQGYEAVKIKNYNLPYIAVGEAYSGQVETSGGSGSYSFELIDGALPQGLSINSTSGLITGVVNAETDWVSFTVKATDSGAPAEYITSATRKFSIKAVISDFDPDIYEPLDDEFETTENTLKPGDASQVHTLHLPDDGDKYKIDMTSFPAGTKIKIETYDLSGTTNTRMYLHTSSYTNDPIGYSESNGALGSRIITTLSNNIYYIYVYGSMGEYAIDVTLYDVDQYEADNDFSTENVMKPGDVSQAHTFHNAGESDYIKLDLSALQAGSTIKLETDSVCGAGDLANTKLSLYNASQDLLAENSNSGIVNYSELIWTVDTPGIYYAVVSDPENKKGTYQFDIQVIDNPYPADAYEAMSDDSFSTSSQVVVGAAAQLHTIHNTGDEDYMKLVITEAQVGKYIRIETHRVQNITGINTILYLYDANFNEIKYDYDDGYANFSKIVQKFTVAGTYYLRVIDVINGTGDYTIDALEVTPPAADAYESDDDTATTNMIKPGDAAQNHTIHAIDDRDYLKLDLSDVAYGSTVVVSTSKLTLDTTMAVRVWNPDGVELGSGGSSAYFTCYMPGIHTISVNEVHWSDFGDYSIEVRIQD
ncbi:MAG: hypothetical protein GY754_36815 [bacterium]|nr:hypothetical protein [bacterium]